MGQRSKQLREELRTCDDVEVRLVNYGHCWSQVITETELITEKNTNAASCCSQVGQQGALSHQLRLTQLSSVAANVLQIQSGRNHLLPHTHTERHTHTHTSWQVLIRSLTEQVKRFLVLMKATHRQLRLVGLGSHIHQSVKSLAVIGGCDAHIGPTPSPAVSVLHRKHSLKQPLLYLRSFA